MTSSQNERARILEFKYPTKAGRPSDKDRILSLYATGQVSREERNLWP